MPSTEVPSWLSRRTSVLGSWSIPGGLAALTIEDPWGLPYSQVLGALGSLQDSLCGLKRMSTFSALWLVRKRSAGSGVGFQLEGRKEAPNPGLSLKLDLVKSEAGSQLTETRVRR